MKRLAWFTGVILATCTAVLLAWEFRAAVVLFVLSLVIAATVRPLVDWFSARRLPRGVPQGNRSPAGRLGVVHLFLDQLVENDAGVVEGLAGIAGRGFVGGDAVEGAVDETGVDVDRKTVTVKLRKDAKFADGSPISADDWLYTFNRALVGSGHALPDRAGADFRRRVRQSEGKRRNQRCRDDRDRARDLGARLAHSVSIGPAAYSAGLRRHVHPAGLCPFRPHR